MSAATIGRGDHEHIPAAWERAPFPCDTYLLIRWLNARHGFAIAPGTRLVSLSAGMSVVGLVEGRYGRGVPVADGEKPYPSEVWNFVLAEEKRVRGGQRSLFGGPPVDDWPAVVPDLITQEEG
jgi:hypothetical protein